MSLNYQETLDFMYSRLPMFSRIGSDAFKKDLTNIRKLCLELGNPQNDFKTIHIGGTNGKGSTTNYLASVLIESGLKVGIYTSPHLVDFRERIKIGHYYIDEDFIIQFIHNIRPKIDEIEPSFFEITVAMAFEYFKKEKVDIALIEVGLGGRLDSTNIITPMMSVITNISLDHTNMLGHTLEEIAYEKAGIIKYKTPFVLGESNERYNHVFVEKSKQEHAPIVFADESVRLNSVQQVVELSHEWCNVTLHFQNPLPSYQYKNLKTILASYLQYCQIEKLEPNPIVFEKGIENMSKNTLFLGRWTVLELKSKRVILECAHNLAGVQELNKTLDTETFENLYVLYGAVKDKDLNDIISHLPYENTFYTLTQADIPRAMPVAELSEIFLHHKFEHITTNPSPIESLKELLKLATERDLILVTGSIFLVGEILRDLETI